MKITKHSLFLGLFSLIAITGFSQSSDSAIQNSSNDNNTSSHPGLRKIAGGNPLKDRNLKIDIDEVALEASIRAAVAQAIASVDEALEKLEIHIEPIEIDLKDIDVNIEPIEIAIHDIDIEVEPVTVEIDDIEMDESHFDFDDNNRDDENYLNEELREERHKAKDTAKKEKEKNKSEKPDKAPKDKTKGLKKIK